MNSFAVKETETILRKRLTILGDKSVDISPDINTPMVVGDYQSLHLGTRNSMSLGCKRFNTDL